jgi:hypothetical protein
MTKTKTYDHLVNSYLVKFPKRLRRELPVPDSFLTYASIGMVLGIMPHEPTDRFYQTKLLVETRHGEEIWTTNHWLVPLTDLTVEQQGRLLEGWKTCSDYCKQ